MITSVDNKAIKDLAKLKQKKYRDETNTYIIEGIHLIEEARKHNVVKAIYTTESDSIFDEAILLSPHVMKKITDAKHVPNYVALVRKQPSKDVTNQVLILENIQDPGNLGTLLRSALAFGYKTVVLDQSVDLYNPKVLRGAQGAHFHLNCHWMTVKNFHGTYPHTLIATALEGETITPVKPPYAIILGNEGQGLKEETLALASHIFTIPIETIDSLNVAVAGSILMHRLKA